MDKIKEQLAQDADQYSARQKGDSPESDYSFGKVIGAYNGYLAGYKAGAEKYEALLREAMEALKAAAGHIDYLTGTDTTVMGLKLKALIAKSKSILND